MSINIWQLNEVFTLRVYKRLVSRPDILWANTYELFAVEARSDGEEAGRQAAFTMAVWESQFHRSDVVFDRAVFSTHVPDGTPYNPSNFASFGLGSIVGQRSANEEPMPLQYCLFVRRDVSFGRNGRLMYRRVLTEGETTSPSGEPTLIPGAVAAFQAILDGPYAGGETGNTMEEELAVWGLRHVMVGDVANVGDVVRQVNGFTVAGAKIKKYNNAYYNRNTPPITVP